MPNHEFTLADMDVIAPPIQPAPDAQSMLDQLEALRLRAISRTERGALRVEIEGEDAPREIAVCDRCGESFYADQMHRVGRQMTHTCLHCHRNVQTDAGRIRKYGRRFGVEIEFELYTEHGGYYGNERYAVPAENVVEALAAAGIECVDDGYSHHVQEDCWKIVPDGSVAYGWELVSPPLTWAQRGQVRTVCETLSMLGAEAAESCGVHVHHEIPDLSLRSIKRLVKSWDSMKEVTRRFVDRSRHNGQWCHDFDRSELENIENLRSIRALRSLYLDRYRALNLECYSRYKTVEMRQHEGTLDADKIIAWIAYGQGFIEAARRDAFPMCPERPSAPECIGVIDSLPITCEIAREHLKNHISTTAMR